MATTTQQYRPLSNVTTGIDCPLCVRDIVDTAANLNNAKRYALAPKLVSLLSCVPVGSEFGSTSECVVLPPFAPRYISGGYTSLRCYFHGVRAQGAGTITWKLYASAGLYRGPYVFDASYLRSGYASGSAIVSSDDPSVQTFTVSLGATRPCVDAGSLIWLLLTATNSNGTTQGHLKSLDVFGRLA